MVMSMSRPRRPTRSAVRRRPITGECVYRRKTSVLRDRVLREADLVDSWSDPAQVFLVGSGDRRNCMAQFFVGTDRGEWVGELICSKGTVYGKRTCASIRPPVIERRSQRNSGHRGTA